MELPVLTSVVELHIVPIDQLAVRLVRRSRLAIESLVREAS